MSFLERCFGAVQTLPLSLQDVVPVAVAAFAKGPRSAVTVLQRGCLSAKAGA